MQERHHLRRRKYFLKKIFLPFFTTILLTIIFLIQTNYSHADVTKNIKTPEAQQSTTIKIFFSPDDKPQKHLIKYINQAKKIIYAAVYMFTDKKIAEALINAKKRNVDVEIISDNCSFDSQYGKIKMLLDNDVPVYLFKVSKPGYRRFNPLMHNKFAIIDEKVWTGSFNWTISANSKNQENVICIEMPTVREKFLAHFEILKNRSNKLKTKKPATRKKCAKQKTVFPWENFFGRLHRK